MGGKLLRCNYDKKLQYMMEVDGSFFFSLLYFCRNKAPQVWFLSSEVWQGPSSKSEAVIASEHLHQRTLEGNGGIKMGTAGTYRRAGRFFFFFFFNARPLFHMCSTCASQSLAPSARPAGSAILTDWKLPWRRWKPVLRKKKKQGMGVGGGVL